MRSALFLVALLVATPAISQKLYKHVDEKGNVTFTDRPPQADQKPEKLKTPNIASPEARRQDEYSKYARQREDQLERQAQQQRYLSQRNREMQAEREKRTKEANPYSPEQQPALPRARR